MLKYTKDGLETFEDFCDIYNYIFKGMNTYLDTPEAENMKVTDDRFANRRAFINYFINMSREQIHTGIEFAALLFASVDEDMHDDKFNRDLYTDMKDNLDITDIKRRYKS